MPPRAGRHHRMTQGPGVRPSPRRPRRAPVLGSGYTTASRSMFGATARHPPPADPIRVSASLGFHLASGRPVSRKLPQEVAPSPARPAACGRLFLRRRENPARGVEPTPPLRNFPGTPGQSVSRLWRVADRSGLTPAQCGATPERSSPESVTAVRNMANDQSPDIRDRFLRNLPQGFGL